MGVEERLGAGLLELTWRSSVMQARRDMIATLAEKSLRELKLETRMLVGL